MTMQDRRLGVVVGVSALVMAVGLAVAAVLVARTYGPAGRTTLAGALVGRPAGNPVPSSRQPASTAVEVRSPDSTVTTTSSPPKAPPGAALAFQRDRMIWVADADGSNARQLTQPKIDESWYVPLAWLPDGRLLGAFSDVPVGMTNRFETVTLDGRREDFHPVKVDPGDMRASAGAAAVSPDGTKVALVVHHGTRCGQCIDRSVVIVKSLQPDGRVIGQMGFRVIETDLDHEWNPVRAVAFGPDSQSLYVLFQSGVVDGDSGTWGDLIRYGLDRLGSEDPPGTEIAGDHVDDFAVAPNGDVAIVADGRVVVRREDGSERDLGEASTVTQVEFDVDGTRLYRSEFDVETSDPLGMSVMQLDASLRVQEILPEASNPVPWRPPRTGPVEGGR